MNAPPDDFVLIQIHLAPSVLAELRAAARHAGMPIDQWLIRQLGIGVRREFGPGGRV